MTDSNHAPMPDALATIPMTYTNWRGETRERRVIPIRLRWGATEWHPQPGWLLVAFDTDKMERREFALADCNFVADPAYRRAAEMRETLRDCAEDLAAELDARYPEASRRYPSEQRRYDRDMEPVHRARALLDGGA